MSKRNPKEQVKIEELLTTKPGKYFLERTKGKNKKQSALAAGYSDGQHITQIEDSVAYGEVVTYFKDALLGQIKVTDIASELVKNIIQDTDRGAKNKAIEIALGKIEPEKIQEKEDKVIVILQ